ncbi:hypothetical protein SCAR479_02233 [Seiridium cardinale]|uniref:Uncharacterized protein n=1 Tax=Seiridium cardinale TaxID=138064 RepID=A0ABR2X5G6_9PEZI
MSHQWQRLTTATADAIGRARVSLSNYEQGRTVHIEGPIDLIGQADGDDGQYLERHLPPLADDIQSITIDENGLLVGASTGLPEPNEHFVEKELAQSGHGTPIDGLVSDKGGLPSVDPAKPASIPGLSELNNPKIPESGVELDKKSDEASDLHIQDGETDEHASVRQHRPESTSVGSIAAIKTLDTRDQDEPMDDLFEGEDNLEDAGSPKATGDNIVNASQEKGPQNIPSAIARELSTEEDPKSGESVSDDLKQTPVVSELVQSPETSGDPNGESQVLEESGLKTDSIRPSSEMPDDNVREATYASSNDGMELLENERLQLEEVGNPKDESALVVNGSDSLKAEARTATKTVPAPEVQHNIDEEIESQVDDSPSEVEEPGPKVRKPLPTIPSSISNHTSKKKRPAIVLKQDATGKRKAQDYEIEWESEPDRLKKKSKISKVQVDAKGKPLPPLLNANAGRVRKGREGGSEVDGDVKSGAPPEKKSKVAKADPKPPKPKKSATKGKAPSARKRTTKSAPKKGTAKKITVKPPKSGEFVVDSGSEDD